MDAKHTPTPWQAVNHNWCTTGIYAVDGVEGGTIAVLDIQAEADEETQSELEQWMAANAAYIVRACNSHEQLVTALKDCVSVMERELNGLAVIQPELRQARAALAAAGAA